MEEEVKKMVTPGVEIVQAVIQVECKGGDKTGRPVAPERGKTARRIEQNRVFPDGGAVIEMEGRRKPRSVSGYHRQKDNNNRSCPDGSRLFDTI